jgi:hypothetical protein
MDYIEASEKLGISPDEFGQIRLDGMEVLHSFTVGQGDDDISGTIGHESVVFEDARFVARLTIYESLEKSVAPRRITYQNTNRRNSKTETAVDARARLRAIQQPVSIELLPVNEKPVKGAISEKRVMSIGKQLSTEQLLRLARERGLVLQAERR